MTNWAVHCYGYGPCVAVFIDTLAVQMGTMLCIIHINVVIQTVIVVLIG